MKRIFLIGIGPGHPDYLTVQAIKAMNKTDVFFLFEKEGRGKNELVDVRRAMLRKYVKGRKYCVVKAMTPPRDRASVAYESAVEDWRGRKQAAMRALIEKELKPNQTGAFLVWGDPSLYDGSIDMLSAIQAEGGVGFDFKVIPGITAIQALTEKHRIPLNRMGGSVRITTGRRLNGKRNAAGETVVVLLDQHSALADFPDKDATLYWGAYLGAKDELLLSGRLGEVLGTYRGMKARAGEKKGWIMDTYLLRGGKRHRPVGK
jgi:precorrin-6A synthase